MENMNIEDYIKEMDLSPELTEKARACKTNSELMALVAENEIELPDSALEAVAGGGCGREKYCDVCGARMEYVCHREFEYWLCPKCGYKE